NHLKRASCSDIQLQLQSLLAAGWTTGYVHSERKWRDSSLCLQLELWRWIERNRRVCDSHLHCGRNVQRSFDCQRQRIPPTDYVVPAIDYCFEPASSFGSQLHL